MEWECLRNMYFHLFQEKNNIKERQFQMGQVNPCRNGFHVIHTIPETSKTYQNNGFLEILYMTVVDRSPLRAHFAQRSYDTFLYVEQGFNTMFRKLFLQRTAIKRASHLDKHYTLLNLVLSYEKKRYFYREKLTLQESKSSKYTNIDLAHGA